MYVTERMTTARREIAHNAKQKGVLPLIKLGGMQRFYLQGAAAPVPPLAWQSAGVTTLNSIFCTLPSRDNGTASFSATRRAGVLPLIELCGMRMFCLLEGKDTVPVSSPQTPYLYTHIFQADYGRQVLRKLFATFVFCFALWAISRLAVIIRSVTYIVCSFARSLQNVTLPHTASQK